MKKLALILPALLMLAPLHLYAQFASVKQKLAVYVAGNIDENIKYVTGTKMVERFTSALNVSAEDRSADFNREIERERGFNTDGTASDATIAGISHRLGMKYVAVANLREMFGQIYADARLFNVETGEIMGSACLRKQSGSTQPVEETVRGATNTAEATTSTR